MKNIINNQLIIIPILYILAKLLWELIPLDILPKMLKVVLVDIIGIAFLMYGIYWFIVNLLWKAPILGKASQKLFGTKPSIQGTWLGKLKYEWDGKKGEKTVFLVVKQNDGYSIHIWLLTDERKSSSIFAEIFEYRGIQRIIYIYSNEESPDNKERNPSHEGLCLLDIVNASNLLQGIYYTNRNTSGELIFDRRKRKIILNYKEAQKLFGIIDV